MWRDDATLFAQTVEDAPRSYRAQFFYGQMMFAQGKRAEGERHLRLAIDAQSDAADVSPLNYLATQYRDAGMCPQALPLYERALANDAERPDVRYGLASCLLATGRRARGAAACAGWRATRRPEVAVPRPDRANRQRRAAAAADAGPAASPAVELHSARSVAHRVPIAVDNSAIAE